MEPASARLVAAFLRPGELARSVPADIMERPDDAIASAHDQDRSIANGDIPDNVVTSARYILNPTDIKRTRTKYRLALGLEIRW
ncbi:MAG: hypothetical protein AAF384_20145 [Pseudomonadota bacterium]